MAANPDYTRSVVDALHQRGRTRIRIQGRSMYPALRHGDQVIVAPVVYDELAAGDMIVFYDKRGIICHRLLRKKQRQCHLKGDTNIWTDPPIGWSQVLGRVTHIVENDGAIRCIDLDSQRRHAALVARFSYFYALYYNILHTLGHCRWWARTPLPDSKESDQF